MGFKQRKRSFIFDGFVYTEGETYGCTRCGTYFDDLSDAAAKAGLAVESLQPWEDDIYSSVDIIIRRGVP